MAIILQKKQEFEIIRRTVLVNPNTYEGRYTQKNKKDALIEFLLDEVERLTYKTNGLIDELLEYKDNYGDIKHD